MADRRSDDRYPPTDIDLRSRADKAARKMVHEERERLSPTEIGPLTVEGVEDITDPEFNPEWNAGDRMVPARHLPKGARTALTNLAKSEAATGTSAGVIRKDMVDETIFRYRQTGMQPAEIARMLGGRMTAEVVQERLTAMLVQMSQFSDDEYRMLQMARLESVINMLWGLAEAGSSDHVKLIIEATDRLSKLLGLEKQVVKTEVLLVTTAQANLFGAAVEAALNVILSHPALKGLLPPDVIDEITGNALMEASNVIEAAQGETVDMKVPVGR